MTLTYATWDRASQTVQVGAWAETTVSGTCELYVSQGEVTVTSSAESTADVSTMTCGELSADLASMSSGPWQAVVTFTTESESGTSAPQTIEVVR